VGTSLKIPGTKRIARESINAVHHTPRGKAIWVNLDPPPSKDYDVWIKGDCQRIPALYEDYARVIEQEMILKGEEIKRKEEEKVRVAEERMEKREREKLRKEENQRAREERRQRKELVIAERQTRELERKQRKAEKEAKKTRRELERATRPTKKLKKEEKMHSRPLTPPLSYDTESTLLSPPMSDTEFAAFVESTPRKPIPMLGLTRTLEYLPTPAPTPQKGQQSQPEQESPLKDKKRKSPRIEGSQANIQHTMSIRFLTDA
jgi:hypothetical protein